MNSKSRPAVLIVEDETLIRMDAFDMIREAGFKTYEASSADQAIALMDQHSDIGILFTDIEMPGSMDGVKLAAYVRDRWPPVVIIIASGAVGLDRSTFPDGASFFPKPYLASQITATLHDIARQFG
ncbi:Response regulator receiver domain-containing protein [Loktanella atrilutea]|uniref:Response regulator receiver domain-containing protein n=1 Tax=Loktanella atrilutea TaxID=366533 RepID=A0A1M5FW43_LOKAT|nr:response regulator [Loktanella atrilutea]SHF95412.1 Response regulator receiver domain-containing protein [Loktanella atrilutea]